MSTLTTDNRGTGGAPENSPAIKTVPQSRADRERIRDEAGRLCASLSRKRPPSRQALEDLGGRLLDELRLPGCHLGFAMVAIDNEFWADQFAAVPPERRLLLLPHCLRDVAACRGSYSSLGLHCAGCGACELHGLKRDAEALGYKVLIMEGTPAVVQVVLSGRADAILGVACLDSLAEAFGRVARLGVPHVAVPLLKDGCADTVAELDVVRAWMERRCGRVGTRTRTFVRLLRRARELFEDGGLAALLAPVLGETDGVNAAQDATDSTQAIALHWLRCGGKRFRPFITLASYGALAHGVQSLSFDADLTDAFPPAVLRMAAGIECLHKASLVHDDIEDDDLWRYGQPTLHRRYGLGPAINVGDYLIGLGYQCICAGAETLGADCTADIIGNISSAHVKLCRGQGAELTWGGPDSPPISPADAQAVYALKTAPAFEAAMFAGIRAGQKPGASVDMTAVRKFCRYLGVAYQVANDLKDWETDGHDKIVAGQDLLAGRPTILRSFATEAGAAGGEELPEAVSGPEVLQRLREAYEERGVFDKARRLVALYRGKAVALAEGTEPEALGELMRFVAGSVL